MLHFCNFLRNLTAILRRICHLEPPKEYLELCHAHSLSSFWAENTNSDGVRSKLSTFVLPPADLQCFLKIVKQRHFGLFLLFTTYFFSIFDSKTLMCRKWTLILDRQWTENGRKMANKWENKCSDKEQIVVIKKDQN